MDNPLSLKRPADARPSQCWHRTAPVTRPRRRGVTAPLPLRSSGRSTAGLSLRGKRIARPRGAAAVEAIVGFRPPSSESDRQLGAAPAFGGAAEVVKPRCCLAPGGAARPATATWLLRHGWSSPSRWRSRLTSHIRDAVDLERTRGSRCRVDSPRDQINGRRLAPPGRVSAPGPPAPQEHEPKGSRWSWHGEHGGRLRRRQAGPTRRTRVG